VPVIKGAAAKGRTEDILHVRSHLSASSEAAQNLSLSHSVQHFCDACLQIDLKLRGVHSRARNGVEASICYQVTRSKRGLPASHTVLAHHALSTPRVLSVCEWYVLDDVSILATGESLELGQ
jgi:hypothetical protein